LVLRAPYLVVDARLQDAGCAAIVFDSRASFPSSDSTGKRPAPGRSRIVGRMLQNFDVCV